MQGQNHNIEYIIGVHVDLPDDIANAVTRARSELDIEYYVGNYEIAPHVTMYISAFPANAFDECVEVFRNSKLKQFTISLRDC